MLRPLISRIKVLGRRYMAGPEEMGPMPQPWLTGNNVTATHATFWWMTCLTHRHITIAGRFCMMLIAIFSTITFISYNSHPLQALVYGLATLIAINFIVALLFRPRVHLERHLPVKASVGEEVDIVYLLRSRSRLPAWDLGLDNLPMPFLRSAGFPNIACLPPGETLEVRSRISFPERGLLRLPQAFVETTFPFGLVKSGSFGEGDRETMVHPQPMKIHLGWRYSGISGQEGEQAKVLDDEELCGIREYRFGDQPRLIHSPSWARHGQPMVKEFSGAGLPGCCVYLDLQPNPSLTEWQGRRFASFEKRVSLAIGTALQMAGSGFRFTRLLQGGGGPEIRFSGASSEITLSQLADALATIEPQRVPSDFEVLGCPVGTLDREKLLIAFLGPPEEAQIRWLEGCVSNGIALHAATFDEGWPEHLKVRLVTSEEVKAAGFK
ncbi:MAG: hypothetical protein RL095_2743 [Verrucomicrobiota bacterium]|jgi:uncharacterized protein (DUF58 family)